MRQAKITPEEALEALKKEGSLRKAAKYLGVSHSAVQRALAKIKESDVEIDDVPDEARDVGTIWAEREKQFAQRKSYIDIKNHLKARIKIDGPVGILHFGDPHLDNLGTDVFQLREHADIVRKTKGMFAVNIGDTTDNWVGRLKRKYENTPVSKREGLLLAEDFIRSLMGKWLVTIGGNHDEWSGVDNPLAWWHANMGEYYSSHEAFLELMFPNGKSVTALWRHKWRGNSMWNTVHAISRAAQRGFAYDMLLGGHTHVSGYAMIPHPRNEKITHCIQIASYKLYDDYATQEGFEDRHISPAVVTVIDPYATKEINLVTVFHDPEAGADYLNFLRRKFK